jgi:hypothetical protein
MPSLVPNFSGNQPKGSRILTKGYEYITVAEPFPHLPNFSMLTCGLQNVL